MRAGAACLSQFLWAGVPSCSQGQLLQCEQKLRSGAVRCRVEGAKRVLQRATDLQQPQNWQGFKAEAGGGRRRRAARARRSGGRKRSRMVRVQCGGWRRNGLKGRWQGLANARGKGWGVVSRGGGELLRREGGKWAMGD